MQKDGFNPPWLVNRLLDESSFSRLLVAVAPKPPRYAVDVWLDRFYKTERFCRSSPEKLREFLIQPLLERIGWSLLQQPSLMLEDGSRITPQWCLAVNADDVRDIIKNFGRQGVSIICEATGWEQPLDEAAGETLLRYLAATQVRFGILTNGHIWRLYSARAGAAPKYIEFDLARALSLSDPGERRLALVLFTFFFGHAAYWPPVRDNPQASPDGVLTQMVDGVW